MLNGFSCVQHFATPWTPTRFFCPWDFPGKNTRVGSHFLLQGIFPTQGLNSHLFCLLHCRWILYHWTTGEVVTCMVMILRSDPWSWLSGASTSSSGRWQDLTFLTEAKDIKKRWQEYTEELYKKDLHNPDNHDGVITHLESDILECKVKWALGSIIMNKARRGDRITVELFQILKDNAVKVLHSMWQQIWKTQQ